LVIAYMWWTGTVRVVIAGAGIAGLALAGGLQLRDYDVTVVEEAPQLRIGGAAISVWNNGALALRKLGIELDGHGRVIERLESWSSKGSCVGWVDAARLNHKFGIEAVTIPRSELLEHLADRLRPGTIRFGAPCEGIQSFPNRAAVELAGGEDLEADLVVGADGHRSVVRSLFAPAGPATPTGWASLQGLTAAPLTLTEGTTSIYATGAEGGIGLMPAGGRLLQWWFDVPWPPDPLPSSAASWLQNRFVRWQGPMRDLLDVIFDSDIEPFPHGWHSVPRRLQRNHVVLVGDAVHAIPPVLAQGANQSIEDAWVLCRELETSPSISGALAGYEKARRRKVAAVSRVARGPMLHFYGLVSRLPSKASIPETICTWSWGTLMQAFSSTLSSAR
jgi:FAD-dependent urate hydroxylase